MPNYNEDRYIPMPYAITKNNELVPFWEIDFVGEDCRDCTPIDKNLSQLFSGVWDKIDKKIIPAETKIVKSPTKFNIGDTVFVQESETNEGVLDTIENITYNGESCFYIENGEVIERHGLYSDIVVKKFFNPVFHMKSGKIVIWEYEITKVKL